MNIPPGRKIAVGGTRYPNDLPGRPTKGPTAREPVAIEPTSATYGAGYNSTSGAPSGELDGVLTPVGRIFAEARSVTAAAGSPAVTVTLISSKRGVRAHVRLASSTIAGGSVRFWTQNPVTKDWALGGVDETLATGTQEAATTDQIVAVGS